MKIVSHRRAARIAAVSSSAVVVAFVVGPGSCSGPAEPPTPPTCGALFDDFDYGTLRDPQLAEHGWVVRSGVGGPGVGGDVRWQPSNVSFARVDDQSVATLAATTNGTEAGTTQAELAQREERFREGTYAARIRFGDSPDGPDGDHVNQTFYALNTLRFDDDPSYSELDLSEYLPNGGWGADGPTNFFTSYETYTDEPFDAQSETDSVAGSLDGWHVVSAVVADDHIRYFVDGELRADHNLDGPYDVYPDSDMALAFNHWFIDLDAHTSGTSTYRQDVDWVLHAELVADIDASPSNVVAGFRDDGVSFSDTLGTC